MLAKLLNGLAVRLASINPVSAEIAKRTSVLIFTSDGTSHGVGTGVLVAPNVVITAAHNFNSANIRKSRVFIPEDRAEGFRIVKSKFDKANDIAALYLDQNSSVTPSELEFEDLPSNGLSRIVLKSVFDGKVLPKKPTDLSASDLVPVVHKGLFLIDDIPHSRRGEASTRNVQLFHMFSEPGHSGAGIFSNDTGKIVTLNCTGNGASAVSGPSRRSFKEFAKSLNL